MKNDFRLKGRGIMRKALCVAVSIAVMVTFSFADVMAITKAPAEGSEPEVTVTEEDIPQAEPEEGIAEEAEDPDATVEEPIDEGTPEEEPVTLEAQTVSAIALSGKAGDGQVSLEWSVSGEVTAETVFTVKMNGQEIATNIPSTTMTYEKTGLTNGTAYTFVVESKEGETVVSSNECKLTPQATTVGDIKNLKYTSDFASVNLSWDPVPNADGYVVYRYDKKKNLYKDTPKEVKGVKETSSKITWRVRAMERKGTSLATYKFSVKAFKNVNGKTIYGKAKVIDNCKPVRALYATFTPKRSGYAYTSAQGKKRGMKLKKGKKYIAKGFVCSRFRVCKSDNNSKINFYPRVLGNNKKLIYSKKITYSPKEAEDFVNHMKLKSNTKYLVWISLYTQHIYFFKGSKGKWKSIKGKNWEISSGKLMSCTATGNWKVFRKVRSRHSLSYWTMFYSQVAMHSWGNPSCFGVPHSGGCVRNTKSQAKWIYNTIPIKTRVCVY